MPEVFGGRLEL